MKSDVAALGVLLLVILAFFWPLVFAGQWIPRGGGDLVSFLWPTYRFAARSLRAGVIPLWNPHLYAGVPFVADNQSGVFYPVNLLTFALFGEPSYAVMEALVVFHVWLAGAGLFALARGLGLRRPAALFGGMAFALSDLFVTHVGNLNLSATAAYLPLLLLLTHRALTGGSPGWAAGAGVVLAVAALAGHGQMLLFLALAFVLYLLYRLAAGQPRGLPLPAGEDSREDCPCWRHAGRTLGLAALIVAVGVGGAALTLLPAREMAAHTGRGHLPYDEATRYSLPPQALIGLLAPGFYGRGQAGFWGPWDRVEVLTGKAMRPTPGMKKTILLGKCMYQAHKDNPSIREMIAVKGCPPKPEDIHAALREAGIDADPELFKNLDRLPGLFMKRYEKRPEFEEGHFRIT